MQYVEAAKLMGQSDTKIIFRHIIPQLIPLTFASIAIAVPGAILGEAALSFLGLGDPSVPTWGQILHEANSASAAVSGSLVVDSAAWSDDSDNRSFICTRRKCT